MRKIIDRFYGSAESSDFEFFVRCDDDTFFALLNTGQGFIWYGVPPIPQDGPEQSTDAIDLEGGL